MGYSQNGWHLLDKLFFSVRDRGCVPYLYIFTMRLKKWYVPPLYSSAHCYSDASPMLGWAYTILFIIYLQKFILANFLTIICLVYCQKHGLWLYNSTLHHSTTSAMFGRAYTIFSIMYLQKLYMYDINGIKKHFSLLYVWYIARNMFHHSIVPPVTIPPLPLCWTKHIQFFCHNLPLEIQNVRY
jgi:hypothetical protein